MALANYSDLATAISAYTHRGDLTPFVADAIALAEQRIYYGCDEEPFRSEPLRLRIMEEQDTGTASSGVITIPSGYLETIRLKATTSGEHRTLSYLPPFAISGYEGTADEAIFYTRVNEGLKVGPTTATYIHDYYKRFDALTSSATTNALMTAHPHLYLWGSLIEAWLYVNNMAKAQWAFSQYRAAVNALVRSDRRSAYGHGLAVVAVS
jgi:hypothetical protein